MSPTGERPPMELRGLRRLGEVLAAVLVLEGASRDELKRASAFGAMMADRCLLVAVDGGLRTCLAGSRRPDLLVGDGDSLRRRPPAEIRAVELAREQEAGDLEGDGGGAAARTAQIAFVAGLAGGRLDHEWANLFELAAHARGFASMIAPTSRGTVIVTRHGCRTATVQGRLVSLFSIGRPAVVTLRGTRWEL